MARRLSTGIDVLDRELGGGVPAGTVVAYEAPPASQGSYCCTNSPSRARRCTSPPTARNRPSATPSRRRTRRRGPQFGYIPGADSLENARRAFRSVPEESTVVIDPADALERADRGRYENFLNELGNHMRNVGGVAVLHCLDTDHEGPLRGTTEHMVDVVFQLQVEENSGEVETTLTVPKFRGGSALDAPIKLNLRERVQVDTSRDIA